MDGSAWHVKKWDWNIAAADSSAFPGKCANAGNDGRETENIAAVERQVLDLFLENGRVDVVALHVERPSGLNDCGLQLHRAPFERQIDLRPLPVTSATVPSGNPDSTVHRNRARLGGKRSGRLRPLHIASGVPNGNPILPER